MTEAAAPDRIVVRFARVTAEGIAVTGDALERPRLALAGRVVALSPAGTLYRDGHPACRSLDGEWDTRGRRACPRCPERGACTPQGRLDLVSPIFGRGVVVRFLLAHTNREELASFAFEARAARDGRSLVGATVRVSVEPRMSHAGRPWGALSFELVAGT